MATVELKISQLITAGFAVTEESDPIPFGVRGSIKLYESSCPDVPLAFSRIEFGSDILWVHQRDSRTENKIEFVGDGVKTLKLICENDCVNDYYFNSYMKAGYSG